MSELKTYGPDDFDVLRIMEKIPHRAPFLLIDRIVAFEKMHRIEAIKGVTYNEPHFLGHFPKKPVMPGVLIIEAMAQAAGVLVVESMGKEAEGKLVYFMSIEEGKFRKVVTPGCILHISATITHSRKTVWKFKGEAKVDDTLVAEANFTAMVVDP